MHTILYPYFITRCDNPLNIFQIMKIWEYSDSVKSIGNIATLMRTDDRCRKNKIYFILDIVVSLRFLGLLHPLFVKNNRMLKQGRNRLKDSLWRSAKFLHNSDKKNENASINYLIVLWRNISKKNLLKRGKNLPLLTIFAVPKSQIFRRPRSGSTRQLSGFRSRWTTFKVLKYPTPRKSW